LRDIISLVPDELIINKEVLEYKNSIYVGGTNCSSKQYGDSDVRDYVSSITTHIKPSFNKNHIRMVKSSERNNYKHKWIHICRFVLQNIINIKCYFN
jgi:hypothetical protein